MRGLSIPEPSIDALIEGSAVDSERHGAVDTAGSKGGSGASELSQVEQSFDQKAARSFRKNHRTSCSGAKEATPLSPRRAQDSRAKSALRPM